VRLHLLFLLLAVGCAERYTLDEVPIEGASAEQRAVVEEELLAFDEWVGQGRVRLSRVAFKSEFQGETADYSGVYDHRPPSVWLRPQLSGGDLRAVLRHELCHAVDYQDKLLSRSHDAFDGLVEHPPPAMSSTLRQEIRDRPNDRRRRSEVFATICESGPLATALLLSSCEPRSWDLVGAAAFLSDEVWTGRPDVAMRPSDGWGSDEVSSPAPFTADGLRASGAEGVPVAALSLFTHDYEESVLKLVNTEDGSEVVERTEMSVDSVYAGFEVEPPADAPTYPDYDPASAVAPTVAAASSAGAARIIVDYRAGPVIRRMAPQVVVHDGAQWSVVDGACPTEASAVFVADDTLYVGWADEESVRWRAVTP